MAVMVAILKILLLLLLKTENLDVLTYNIGLTSICLILFQVLFLGH